MKRLWTCLALAAMIASFPLGAPSRAGASSGCVTSAAKIDDAPKLSLPEDAKTTSKTIAFEVDVGSDGRVRGMQMDQSSGDPKVDLSARQTLQAASYQPPQTGCVAYSGRVYLSYQLTPNTAAPIPPAQLTPTCTPYISVFLTPIARDRKRTGTATVSVDLDASATRTGTAVLRKSTGSPVLDQEAIRLAATGHYRFGEYSSCTPQAFTYLLEMTFQ